MKDINGQYWVRYQNSREGQALRPPLLHSIFHLAVGDALFTTHHTAQISLSLWFQDVYTYPWWTDCSAEVKISTVQETQFLIYEAQMFHHGKHNIRKMRTTEWGRHTGKMWEVGRLITKTWEVIFYWPKKATQVWLWSTLLPWILVISECNHNRFSHK